MPPLWTIVLRDLLCCASLLLLVPVGVLFAEVLLAVTGSDAPAVQQGERRRLAILVPAHNEAAVIADTLRSIRPQLDASDRLLVVADNCTDNTAAVAATEGAVVVSREEAERRGKGFALDFGVRHLTRDAPDVVIVIDADCRVAPGAIDQLTRACVRTVRPVQALYLLEAPKNAGPLRRIAQFACTVKNEVRPRGLHRLGLPCQLMGSGMAFPWGNISGGQFATGHIVEDLKFGIDLATGGTPPVFCPDALVTSTLPASQEGIHSQRTRWEHGHLGLLCSVGPRLLVKSLWARNVGLLVLAMDLLVPPLALLTLLVAAIWLASVALYADAGERLALALSTIVAGLLACAILLAWIRYGRRILSIGNLALAGAYMLWKVPLYLRFLSARQVEWIRSKRDTDGKPRGRGST